MGYIYCFKNLINGKCYIGQTIRNPKVRYAQHLKTDDGTVFHNALKKYGYKGNRKISDWYQAFYALEELLEEEQDKKNKIIEEGVNKVEKLNNKYSDIDKINSKHSINIIKEKLKLDVIKSLNTCVLK